MCVNTNTIYLRYIHYGRGKIMTITFLSRSRYCHRPIVYRIKAF